jgi:DNA-binding response OmpR family regulator
MERALSTQNDSLDWGQFTILVVEDEPMIRLDLIDELCRVGFTVREAATADAACEMLLGTCDVHLVVTDIRMPGRLNGIGLAKWIKETRPHVPVVFVSGEVTARDLPRISDAAFVKPLDYRRFVRRIRELLSKQ